MVAWLVVAAACFLSSTAAFQLNGVAMPHGALPCAARSRAPAPTLGFFDEMKKGFEAGMPSPSSSSSGSADATEESDGPPQLSFFDQMKQGFEAGTSPSAASSSPASPADATEESATPSDSPSMLGEMLKKIFMPEPLTEEEQIAQRIADGEGVVWSADYSRAWRSKKDMPQDELSVEEAIELSALLSVPLPAEVEERLAGDAK